MLSLLHIIPILGSTLSWQAAAQATTNVVCAAALWTYNEEQQSPCQVASILQGACNGGKWSVSAISPDQAYGGPNQGQSSPCQCSTVVYSMVAACGACQSALIDTWVNWKTNCSSNDISISRYPLSIPPTTSIPSWAYLNVTGSGTWNETGALTVHNAGTSDSTAILPTATGSSATVSSATVTSSSTPVAASSKNSSHTGAIVGGVVGGVAGISLLGLAVFMLLRRRKPNIEEYRYPRSAKSGNREKIDLAAGGIPTPQPTPVPTYSVQAPLRLYDPDDPSTFPPPTSPMPSFSADATHGTST